MGHGLQPPASPAKERRREQDVPRQNPSRETDQCGTGEKEDVLQVVRERLGHWSILYRTKDQSIELWAVCRKRLSHCQDTDLLLYRPDSPGQPRVSRRSARGIIARVSLCLERGPCGYYLLPPLQALSHQELPNQLPYSYCTGLQTLLPALKCTNDYQAPALSWLKSQD